MFHNTSIMARRLRNLTKLTDLIFAKISLLVGKVALNLPLLLSLQRFFSSGFKKGND